MNKNKNPGVTDKKKFQWCTVNALYSHYKLKPTPLSIFVLTGMSCNLVILTSDSLVYANQEMAWVSWGRWVLAGSGLVLPRSAGCVPLPPGLPQRLSERTFSSPQPLEDIQTLLIAHWLTSTNGNLGFSLFWQKVEGAGAWPVKHDWECPSALLSQKDKLLC